MIAWKLKKLVSLFKRMIMKKRWIYGALFGCLLGSMLTGCGSGTEEAAPVVQEETEASTE